MRTTLSRFLHSDHGATAIEYGLIAAFIVLAIVAVLPLIGGSLRDMFQTVMDAFAS